MKKLSLAEPIIRYSPTIDHFFAILNLYPEKTLPWIIENYIEVVFNPHAGGNYLITEFLDIFKAWWNCPFINVSRMDRRLLENTDIIEFIKSCIDKDSYVSVLVDTYYINSYCSYLRQHYPHEIFIYGYDEGLFYTSDYFDFIIGTTSTAAFTEFSEAYFAFSKEEKDYLRGVVIFNVEHDVIENGKSDSHYDIQYKNSIYVPDKKIIKDKLIGFLDSSPLVLASYPNEYDPCFDFKTGFAAFEILKDELSEHNLSFFIKPLSLLCCHIKLMAIRIKYLQEHCDLIVSDLYDHCMILENRSVIIRNRCLKSLYHNINNTVEIKKALTQLIVEYKNIIERLINVL